MLVRFVLASGHSADCTTWKALFGGSVTLLLVLLLVECMLWSRRHKLPPCLKEPLGDRTASQPAQSSQTTPQQNQALYMELQHPRAPGREPSPPYDVIVLDPVSQDRSSAGSEGVRESRAQAGFTGGIITDPSYQSLNTATRTTSDQTYVIPRDPS